MSAAIEPKPVPDRSATAAWRWPRIGDLLVGAAILIVACLVLLPVAKGIAPTSGEGNFIERSRFFDLLFLRGNVTAVDWSKGGDVHTQPMLVNYLVGGWMWAKGYNLRALASSKISDELKENRERGITTRADDLVRVAREPMVGLAVGVVVLLYLVGRLLGGLLSGVVAAGLGLLSPLAQEALVRAKGEAPLMFCVLLALLVAVLGARRGREGGLPWLWAVGLGVVLGLGVQAKLTAVLSLAAVVVWAALMVVLAVRRGGVRAAVRSGRGWALATVVALVVFVISNPHLYPNPPLHAFHLFAERADKQDNKMVDQPLAVPNILDRPGYVLRASLFSGTFSGSRGVPLEAVLVPLGAAILAWRCWTRWRNERQVPLLEGLVLVTVAVYFGGVSAALTITPDRYFLPTLIPATLFSGVAASLLIRQCGALVARVVQRGAAVRPSARMG